LQLFESEQVRLKPAYELSNIRTACVDILAWLHFLTKMYSLLKKLKQEAKLSQKDRASNRRKAFQCPLQKIN